MFLIATALAVAPVRMDSTRQRQFLDYLVGTWRVVSADPAGGEDLQVCYSVGPFVGEKWISGVATSSTLGFGSKDVWGHDQASGELMRTIFDSSGTYAVVRSRGWTGDSLVLQGTAISARGTLPVRETIRRASEKQFEATWEALRDGKWSRYAVETATRAVNGKCNLS